MRWYSKYLPVYGKDISEVNPENIKSVIQALKQNVCYQSPEVSVVIIAHNEEKNLLACLWSLADNRSKYPFEIIVVNNGSTDKTQELIDLIGVKSFYEERLGAGSARQCGLERAQGHYYLCIDSDTIYPPSYVQTMTAALKQKDTAAVYSLWNFIPDEKNSFFSLSIYQFFRDIHKLLQSIKRPELGVGGAAFGFPTAYGRKIGFRTDIKRGEDGSMALALKGYGKLRFLINQKARVMTSSRTLSREGSLLQIFFRRLTKSAKGIKEYTHTKSEYADMDENKF